MKKEKYAPYSWAWLLDNVDCDFKLQVFVESYSFRFFVKEKDYEYLKQKLYEIMPMSWYYEIKTDNTVKGKTKEDIYNG